MKKIFALFCAVFLMPTFSAQAWIGGPFSNNSFFEPAGTDGVYEATATALNGIGSIAFSVGNEFQGAGAQSSAVHGRRNLHGHGGRNIGRPIGYTQIKSGNTVIEPPGLHGRMSGIIEVFLISVVHSGPPILLWLVTGAAEAYSSEVLKAAHPLLRASKVPSSTSTFIISAVAQDLTPVSFISSSFKPKSSPPAN